MLLASMNSASRVMSTSASGEVWPTRLSTPCVPGEVRRVAKQERIQPLAPQELLGSLMPEPSARRPTDLVNLQLHCFTVRTWCRGARIKSDPVRDRDRLGARPSPVLQHSA
jgi:hypothetical protein